MKKTFFVLGTALLMSLGSCGGGDKANEGAATQDDGTLKPETTKVSGDLGDCFVVIDRNYKPVKDFGTVLTIEVERTEAELPFDSSIDVGAFGTYFTDGKEHVLTGFGLDVLDKDGNILQTNKATAGGLGGPYSHEDVISLIKLKPGEKGTIRFSLNDPTVENGKQFRLSSAYEMVEPTGKSSDIDLTGAEDIYKKAMEQGQKMYDDAMKQAQDMYDDAMKQAQDMYNFDF